MIVHNLARLYTIVFYLLVVVVFVCVTSLGCECVLVAIRINSFCLFNGMKPNSNELTMSHRNLESSIFFVQFVRDNDILSNASCSTVHQMKRVKCPRDTSLTYKYCISACAIMVYLN